MQKNLKGSSSSDSSEDSSTSDSATDSDTSSDSATDSDTSSDSTIDSDTSSDSSPDEDTRGQISDENNHRNGGSIDISKRRDLGVCHGDGTNRSQLKSKIKKKMQLRGKKLKKRKC